MDITLKITLTACILTIVFIAAWGLSQEKNKEHPGYIMHSLSRIFALMFLLSALTIVVTAIVSIWRL